jgi:hypothetical protein
MTRRRGVVDKAARLTVSIPPLGAALAIAFSVLGVVAVGRLASHHSVGYFTRDPAAITNQAAYLGLVTFFGLFGWSAAATALVFAGFIAATRRADRERNACLIGAAAVAYLMLDDAFQFHEYVYPRALGIGDAPVEAVYVLATVALLYLGRDFLGGTNYRLLVVAGIFFAASVGLDEIITSERVIGIEDGAKLIGIYILAAYCFDTALLELRTLMRPLAAPAV